MPQEQEQKKRVEGVQSQLQDRTLLGKTARSLAILLLRCFLGASLLLGRLLSLLRSLTRSSCRIRGLRTGTAMQSLAAPGDDLVEALALGLGDLKLEGGGLARTIGTGEGACAPGATTVNLIEVGQEAEGILVAQRNVNETVVGEGAHGGQSSGLLTTTGGTGGDEETGVLAIVATGGPDGAGLVPEGLPLSGEVTVTSGDTKEDGIVLQEVVGLNSGVGRLGRGVHLGQNLIGESLGDLEDVDFAAGGLNALLLSLGQLLDVAVQRVLQKSLVRRGGEAREKINGKHTKTIATLGAIVNVWGNKVDEEGLARAGDRILYGRTLATERPRPP